LKFVGQLRTWLKKSKQRTKLKRRVSVRAEIEQIRGQIKEIRCKSLLVNWESKCTNSESKNKMKIIVNFGVDNWVWQGWICMNLKVWRQLYVQLKTIGRTWTQLKFFKS
jgi:hypothetical protein